MNEISRTADEGDLERCEKCGSYEHQVFPIIENGEELVTCFACTIASSYVTI